MLVFFHGLIEIGADVEKKMLRDILGRHINHRLAHSRVLAIYDASKGDSFVILLNEHAETFVFYGGVSILGHFFIGVVRVNSQVDVSSRF